MVDDTFTLVPKAWTFLFCQFTSNSSEVASLAIIISSGRLQVTLGVTDESRQARVYGG